MLSPAPHINDRPLLSEHERGDGLGTRYVRQKGMSGKRQMNRPSVVGNMYVVATNLKLEDGIDQDGATHLHPSQCCAVKRGEGQASAFIYRDATEEIARFEHISMLSGRFVSGTTLARPLPSLVSA